ncbi:MAG: SH3 domain-containing protein [Lachnospiraceae bacterium]|nr:SH3 domain-containing protein [Lachnospiraceae bacterium]
MNDFFTTAQKFFHEYRRYVAAAVVVLLLAAMITVATSSKLNPMAGAYGSYNDATSNEELTELLNTYYTAYDNNDRETLESVASPFSERELSYIEMMSQYIDSHTIEELYTKDGSEKGSLLVSAKVGIKYNALEENAPGLDFFYVEKGENGYHINNAYSLFNLQNGDLEVDPAVTSLIAVFEGQPDVAELQSKVQAEHEERMLSDATYNAFFTTSIREAISQWAAGYEAALAEAKAAEEAQAAAAAEAAQAGQKAAGEEANKSMVRVTAKVNVRESASRSASSLGQVAEGTELSKYSEDGDWSEVDFNGSRGYIKTEYLEAVNADASEAAADDTADAQEDDAREADTEGTDAAEANTEEADSNDRPQAAEDMNASLKKGDSVTMSDSVNIRLEPKDDAKKVAVAYQGSKVEIIKVYTNGWTEVKYDGKTGYMKTNLVK